MAYQSFDNSKNKLEKTWNRVEDNTNKLNNIPITNLNYNSINFNKKIITIPILTDVLLATSPLIKVETILLENYPEWAINMIEPFVSYRMEDAFTSFSLLEGSFSEANANGTLKNNDISITSQNLQYWFNHIDKKNFLLKIFYGVAISQAVVVPLGYSSTAVPTFVTLSLKIYNHRIYETMNEKSD